MTGRQATPDVFASAGSASSGRDDVALVVGGALVGDWTNANEIPIEWIIVPPRLRRLDVNKARDVAQSIQEIGLLNALTVRPDGTLVAGRHRLEALRMLDWKRVPVRVLALDDLAAELAEIDENLIRNELTFLERGEHLSRRKEIYEALYPETKNGAKGGGRNGVGVRLTENETVSFSVDTAAKTGTTARSIQQDVRIANKLDADVRDMLRETPVADRKRELLIMTRMDRDEQLETARRLQDGAESVYEAIRQQQQERIEEAVQTIATPWLLVGDFRVRGAEIPDSSVDLIFTDPPYDAEAAALFDGLAKLAARVLKPGGLLMTYSGQLHLPQIYAAMGQHLTYMWTCAIGHSGGATWFRKWHLLNQWKPVLMYGKPPIAIWWRNSFPDFVSGGKEKADHDWQQSLDEATHYISAVCPAGGVVLDPFLGSGTSLLAAKRLGLQYIGIEADPDTAARARLRVEDMQ